MTPRSRVTIYVGNHVQVDTYTCPTSQAHSRALEEVQALGNDAFAVIATLDGSLVYRVPERDFRLLGPDGSIMGES